MVRFENIARALDADMRNNDDNMNYKVLMQDLEDCIIYDDEGDEFIALVTLYELLAKQWRIYTLPITEMLFLTECKIADTYWFEFEPDPRLARSQLKQFV